jgi:hypothetical protein
MNVWIKSWVEKQHFAKLVNCLEKLEVATIGANARSNLREIEKVLVDFVNSGDMSEITKKEVESISANLHHRALFSSKALRMAESTRYAILLTMLGTDLSSQEDSLKQDEFVFSSPGDWYIVNFGPDDLLIDVYDLPQNWNNEVFDKELTLGEKKSVILQKGSHFFVDGKSIVMSLITRVGMNLNWSFSKGTRKAFTATPATAPLGRIQQSLQLGAIMADGNLELTQAFIERAKSYTDHDAHYIRWAAIRAIFYLDPLAAKEFLVNAASDQHPHVRNAAAQTLVQLKTMEASN